MSSPARHTSTETLVYPLNLDHELGERWDPTTQCTLDARGNLVRIDVDRWEVLRCRVLRVKSAARRIVV